MGSQVSIARVVGHSSQFVLISVGSAKKLEANSRRFSLTPVFNRFNWENYLPESDFAKGASSVLPVSSRHTLSPFSDVDQILNICRSTFFGP